MTARAGGDRPEPQAHEGERRENEWLYACLSCDYTEDAGPEAGARAYAYGAACVSRIVPLYRGDPQMVEVGGGGA